MLCGLPASGKSTLAKELSKNENATVLSSDEIRKELLNDVNNQDHNVEVFEEMNKRANKLIQQGRNVIYDATNINRKRRKHLINNVIKADENIVYYMNEHVISCYFRDEKRERNVGNEVINKMYKNMQIPVKNEGWDQVIYTTYPNESYRRFKNDLDTLIQSDLKHDELFEKLSGYIQEFKDIYNLAQDSTYHSFSVSRHTYHVYKTILENYHEQDKLIMLWAALFHDIGKAFCKSFVNYKGEETRYAHFIGHENVSSQLAAVYLDLFGYDVGVINQVTKLVQFHMKPMNWTDKSIDETKELLGKDLFNKLMFLYEADSFAK
jgi:predicted kinase